MQFTPSTLVIVRTGDPPPAIESRRGPYSAWIRQATGEQWGGPVVEVDARGELPSLLGAGAVVITGSPASVTERAPWMLRLEGELRGLLGAERPVFGVCFGHQMLAQAMGGEVGLNPRGREIGTVEVERLVDDPLLAGLGPRFAVNATHADTVVRLPSGARVLARNERDEVQAFALGSAFGVQFHPEIDGDIMRSYLHVRRPLLEQEGLPVDAMLAEARDTPAGPRVLQNFLSMARKNAPSGAP